MSAFLASFQRELRLRAAKPAQLLYPPAFAILVALLIGFAVGASPNALRLIAPATLFIALLLAIFLALEQIFANDVSDGTLDALIVQDDQLISVLYGKAFGFWLSNIAAIGLALPILMILLKLDSQLLGTILLALLFSSLSLSFLGLCGAALIAKLQAEGNSAGSMLLLLLVLPQAVPILIFTLGAVSAASVGESPASALYFSAALAVAYVSLAGIAARAALRS